MDDDASSANSVKNFWHHLKKLGSDNSDHVTEEIISMVNEGHEQGVRLCIQFQTYLQCPVHSPHNVTVGMTYFIL